jgi:isoleucyl-tRNA synthetase
MLTGCCRDGKKMSKSLRNYPDPNKMFDEYGADATRFLFFALFRSPQKELTYIT